MNERFGSSWLRIVVVAAYDSLNKGDFIMASLKLNHIYKIYSGNVTAVSDFCLDIEDKEFIVLVGPSGCGKSTTLRMVAGLEEISEGELYIGDRLVNDVAPKDRDIAMVFQNYALYPHMTVYDNMAFGLKLRKKPKDEIDKLVREAAKILSIEQLLNRKPKALSGGQRQRVALGRAIVRDPKVFLMDEPLSNLDAKLRASMRVELIELHKRLKTTFIYVTHDQLEAMTLSTKVCLMEAGKLRQFAPPLEIYQRPENIFVADFMGNPTMNFLDAEMTQCEQNTAKLSFCGIQAKYTAEASLPATVKDVVIGIRPEHIGIMEDGQVKASIYTTLPTGMETTVKVMLGGQILSAVVFGGVDYAVDQQIAISFLDSQILLFNKATGDRIAVGKLEIL